MDEGYLAMQEPELEVLLLELVVAGVELGEGQLLKLEQDLEVKEPMFA